MDIDFEEVTEVQSANAELPGWMEESGQKITIKNLRQAWEPDRGRALALRDRSSRLSVITYSFFVVPAMPP